LNVDDSHCATAIDKTSTGHRYSARDVANAFNSLLEKKG